MNMTTAPSNQLKATQHQLAAQELVIQQLRDALEKITQFASVQICSHDETYRGGNIWEICSQCGAKWADGEGGKPEFVEPKQITEAIKALAITASTEHLEAWYMEMVGEVAEYLYTYTDDYGRIIQDISVDRQGREYTSVPLHAIKPFKVE